MEDTLTKMITKSTKVSSLYGQLLALKRIELDIMQSINEIEEQLANMGEEIPQ